MKDVNVSFVSSKNREQNQQKETLDLLKAKGFNFTAEREGFEPPVRLRTTVFKTVAIDHSAISPNLIKCAYLSKASAKLML